MQLCPLDRVQRRLQELLRRVLLADMLFAEAVFRKFLDEQLVARQQVLLGETGVVHERLVLKKEGQNTPSRVGDRELERKQRTKTWCERVHHIVRAA